MKKLIYLIAFIFLGILLQFLVHAAAEIVYIKLLVKNFEAFSLGITWQGWFTIHKVFGVILFIAGGVFGYWQGRYWWQKIYVEKSVKGLWNKLT